MLRAAGLPGRERRTDINGRGGLPLACGPIRASRRVGEPRGNSPPEPFRRQTYRQERWSKTTPPPLRRPWRSGVAANTDVTLATTARAFGAPTSSRRSRKRDSEISRYKFVEVQIVPFWRWVIPEEGKNKPHHLYLSPLGNTLLKNEEIQG